MAIERFRGDAYFLSSMFPIEPPDGNGITVLEGLVVPTVENIYQAGKFTDDETRAAVLHAPNGFAAKHLADKFKKEGKELREDWEAIQIPTMRASVALKFGQNLSLAERLAATGEERLVEGQPGQRFSFWGVAPIGSENGLNWLGHILMDTREYLNKPGEELSVRAERLPVEPAIMALSGVAMTAVDYVDGLLRGQPLPPGRD